MRLHYIFILLYLGTVLFACDTRPDTNAYEIALIPKPQQMKLHDGRYKFVEKNSYYIAPDFQLAGNFLKIFLENGSNFKLK